MLLQNSIVLLEMKPTVANKSIQREICVHLGHYSNMLKNELEGNKISLCCLVHKVKFTQNCSNNESFQVFTGYISTGSYILVQGLRDELPFTVDAGVGALPGNLLLLLRDAAWRRRRPTCVQGTWGDDSLKSMEWGKRKNIKRRVKEGYESAQKKREVNKWRTKKEIKAIKMEGVKGYGD